MGAPTALPVVAERWPSDLLPSTCDFGPSRNDISQASPVSRTESVIRRGRRFWTCNLTWTAAETDMASLRLWLEALEGSVGSVILWDFTSPWPQNPVARDYDQSLPQIAELGDITWTNGNDNFDWLAGDASVDWIGSDLGLSGGFLPQGTKSVPLIGLPANQPALLKAGEYIQLNRRLYILAQDLSTDVNGDGAAMLMTPTLEPLLNGMPVLFKEAGCEMRLADQDWKHTRDAGNPFHTVTATFIETSKNFGVGGVQFAA